MQKIAAPYSLKEWGEYFFARKPLFQVKFVQVGYPLL